MDMLRFRPWLFAVAVLLAVPHNVRGQDDLTPEALRNIPLSELEPPYTAFRDRDYNRLKEGDPERPEVLIDLPEGGMTVLSIAECAVECTKTPDCNAASWYGATPEWSDVRNCWLKQLEPACQLPADAEIHNDNRAFLIARPRECNGQPSIAPTTPSAALGPDAAPDATADASGEATANERSADLSQPRMQGDTDETINTPAEVQAVLGDRQMNSDVPNSAGQQVLGAIPVYSTQPDLIKYTSLSVMEEGGILVHIHNHMCASDPAYQVTEIEHAARGAYTQCLPSALLLATCNPDMTSLCDLAV